MDLRESSATCYSARQLHDPNNGYCRLVQHSSQATYRCGLDPSRNDNPKDLHFSSYPDPYHVQSLASSAPESQATSHSFGGYTSPALNPSVAKDFYTPNQTAPQCDPFAGPNQHSPQYQAASSASLATASLYPASCSDARTWQPTTPTSELDPQPSQLNYLQNYAYNYEPQHEQQTTANYADELSSEENQQHSYRLNEQLNASNYVYSSSHSNSTTATTTMADPSLSHQSSRPVFAGERYTPGLSTYQQPLGHSASSMASQLAAPDYLYLASQSSNASHCLHQNESHTHLAPPKAASLEHQPPRNDAHSSWIQTFCGPISSSSSSSSAAAAAPNQPANARLVTSSIANSRLDSSATVASSKAQTYRSTDRPAETKNPTGREPTLGRHQHRTNQCAVCGRNYARPSTLKTHLRTHTNERPFKCNVCEKTFSQAANLTAHQRVHTGERPFSCPTCGRQFSQSSSVITHLRTHSGERPYRCNMCNRTFSDSSTLTKHCRIHSGEKPYQCGFCPLNFSQSGNLSRHLKLHLISQSADLDTGLKALGAPAASRKLLSHSAKRVTTHGSSANVRFVADQSCN